MRKGERQKPKPKPTAKKRRMEDGQSSLDRVVVRSGPTSTTKQDNFNEALQRFVVYGMKTYSTVDDPYFEDMIATLDPRVKVMSRQTLMRRISTMAEKDHEKTKAMLKEAKYVGTGADIWSCSQHGYMGVTATFLLPSFVRVNRALACEHFKNPHNGPRIAQLISGVHERYDLEPPQLVGSVTDNGPNVVSAFTIGSVDSQVDPIQAELMELADTLPSHQR